MLINVPYDGFSYVARVHCLGLSVYLARNVVFLEDMQADAAAADLSGLWELTCMEVSSICLCVDRRNW